MACRAEAQKCWLRAARRGNAAAVFHLACLVHEEDGLTAALSLVYEAAVMGSMPAKVWIYTMQGDSPPEANNFIQSADEFLHDATEVDQYPPAMLITAQRKIHSKNEIAEGNALLQQTARTGYLPAMHYLKMCVGGPWIRFLHVSYEDATQVAVWAALLAASRFRVKLPNELWYEHILPNLRNSDFVALESNWRNSDFVADYA